MQKTVSKCVKCKYFKQLVTEKGWKVFSCARCDTKTWLGGIPENETLIECCSQFKPISIKEI